MRYLFLYNYWIVLAIIIFVRFIFSKSLSPYNIKWIILYLVYVLLVYAELDIDFKAILKYDDLEEIIWSIFLIPLCTYLIFPIIYHRIKDNKVIKWINTKIDTVYNRIKALS